MLRRDVVRFTAVGGEIVELRFTTVLFAEQSEEGEKFENGFHGRKLGGLPVMSMRGRVDEYGVATIFRSWIKQFKLPLRRASP
jgi:hypothetical protein